MEGREGKLGWDIVTGMGIEGGGIEYMLRVGVGENINKSKRRRWIEIWE